MNEHIKVEAEDGVLKIAFARPEKKNALTNAMYRAAREALQRAENDNAIRVILFHGEGNAFTAGNDLGDFAEVSAGQGGALEAHAFIQALVQASKPIVAAVPGIAVGIGTTLLLHCDLVYVADSAVLAAPFVNLALVPEAASSLLMPMRMGYARAFAMFALGESITGLEAAALGLANKALPQDQVLASATESAKRLANQPVGALIATKKLMRNADVLMAQVQHETVLFNERLQSEEAKTAFDKFLKRSKS